MSIVDGWENMAEQWDASDGDEGSNWHRALLHLALLKVLGPLAGRRVLDVGCGNGSLARQGTQVTGVDASAPIIVRAQQREVQEKLGIVYYVVDAALMEPIGDARFDCVVSGMALQDMPDVAGTIREAARVLQPMERFRVRQVMPGQTRRSSSGLRCTALLMRVRSTGDSA
jgi:ubiquinone/menaquinone biosynthesis C-methylase UbiE